MQTTQADTTTQATDYPQWVIVENAGTDAEDVWSDHHTFKAALKELESCGVWALVVLTLYSSGSDPPALEVLPTHSSDCDPPR